MARKSGCRPFDILVVSSLLERVAGNVDLKVQMPQHPMPRHPLHLVLMLCKGILVRVSFRGPLESVSAVASKKYNNKQQKQDGGGGTNKRHEKLLVLFVKSFVIIFRASKGGRAGTESH